MNQQVLIGLVQNDYGYTLNFNLQDSTGAVVDITGATLTFNCQSVSDFSVKFSGAMTITNATQGACAYQVQQDDFKVDGNYSAQIEVSYSAGEVIRFPGITIEVAAAVPQT